MKMRRALFFYCIAAVVVLLVIGWYLATSVSRIGADLRLALEAAAPLQVAAQQRRRAVVEMEEEQRRLRPDLSPAEAIQFSMHIQVAQMERNEAEAELARATARIEALRGEHNARKLRLIPVLGLLLLHAVGALLFNPREASAAPRRRREARPERRKH